MDWIGISLYNLDRAQGQSIPARNDVFSVPTSQMSLYASSYPFYPTYVASKNKPFIFSETGAAINYDIAGNIVRAPPVTPDYELRVKQSWWSQILRESVLNPTGGKLARLKAMVWFEEYKNETSYDDANVLINRDYRITFNDTVRNALQADFRAIGNRITIPGKFQFTCDGNFNFQ